MKTYKGDLDKAERRAKLEYIKILIEKRNDAVQNNKD